jgi:hypothetical protein
MFIWLFVLLIFSEIIEHTDFSMPYNWYDIEFDK